MSRKLVFYLQQMSQWTA